MNKEEKELKELLAEVRKEMLGDGSQSEGRTFANPQNTEEAEGSFPTMEELASKVHIKTKNGWRRGTKEEILRDGSLLDKVKLYYSGRDLDGYFDTDGRFSKDDLARVQASITGKEDIELIKQCASEFNTLIEFGRRLSYQFKRFQTAFSVLAVLLNKWRSYEEAAEQLTKLYEIVSKVTGKAAGAEGEERVSFNQERKKEVLQTFFNGMIKYEIGKGAFLAFDDEREAFYIDPGISTKEQRSLYAQILKEAKETRNELCDFKAYVKAAEEYLENSIMHYIPISIQMSIDNAKEERYTRYLVKDLSFFRSELNSRRERGETISQEDEKRAVIPDYYDCKPTAAIYRDCKRGFKLIESGIAT